MVPHFLVIFQVLLVSVEIFTITMVLMLIYIHTMVTLLMVIIPHYGYGNVDGVDVDADGVDVDIP